MEAAYAMTLAVLMSCGSTCCCARGSFRGDGTDPGIVRRQPVPAGDGAAVDRQAAGDRARRGLCRSRAAGAGADRHRDQLRHDGLRHGAGAALAGVVGQRPCRRLHGGAHGAGARGTGARACRQGGGACGYDRDAGRAPGRAHEPRPAASHPAADVRRQPAGHGTGALVGVPARHRRRRHAVAAAVGGPAAGRRAAAPFRSTRSATGRRPMASPCSSTGWPR